MFLWVSLGAEEFVESLGERRRRVLRRVRLQLRLLPLRGRAAPLRLEHGALGARAPGHGGVAQSLAQSAVPEQGVVEHPVHPVSQGRDRRVQPVVQPGDG